MKRYVITISLFVFLVIFYPVIATRNIIKNEYIYDVVISFWSALMYCNSLIMFALTASCAKIRTNLLRTVLHKVIFFIFNISLLPLCLLLIKNKLSWGSKNLGFMIALLDGIFVLIFSPELKDSKGERLLSLYSDTYLVCLYSKGKVKMTDRGFGLVNNLQYTG